MGKFSVFNLAIANKKGEFFGKAEESVYLCAIQVKEKKVNMKRDVVINQIKEVARKAIPHNGHVLLYGSRARGDAREDSDWDILIILDKQKIEKADYDNVVYPFTDLGWNIGEAIIPVIYTKEEWKKSSFLPFYKNVERDKIVLL